MWKRFIQLVAGKECELKERMLRTIIMVGGAATIIACVEIFLVMEVTSILLPILVILLLVMGFALFVTFKYKKYDLAAILLGLIIVVMVFPLMFWLSGGIESGASVWLALGLLYIFIMFSGKKMIFFLGLSAAAYGVTYWAAYAYPEIVTPMPGRGAAYLDAYFSVIVVGVVAGAILKIHMNVFEEEHKLNMEQKEEIARNSDSKNAFFANVSHEIRSPINAIIGLTEMIMRIHPEGETREYAQDIQLASNLLLNQVNDILDISQVEMNKMKIIPVKYQTGQLFGELAELIRVQTQKKQLEFVLDIDPHLPSVLMGDEKRLKQVLLNILDNAVKYTEEGSVTMSVQGEENENGELTLKVKIADTGIGIRKEDMDYLYDSFNRADERRNTHIVGSGLGLAITKQLVDLMNGEINVDSIYTKGSIFTVIIKQKIIDSEPVGVIGGFSRTGADGEIYRPSFEAPEARILVVDDNRMNSLVASRLLSSTKMQVDVAGSGLECLEMTRKKFYHVILLDYMMPDMNGRDTMVAIRNQENGLCRDAAMVVLTGNALSGARESYLEEGFDGYVEKPIQGKLLETEIMQFLPADIIEYCEPEKITAEETNQVRRISSKKRKKIYITADCACDIPQELLEKYNIDLMYLYIKTPHGRFVDTKEIDSDSLTQYITPVSSLAYGDAVTVAEYEEFFAEVLTKAERVIHIALASRTGASYRVAVAAARGFDHVHVIDSGQISAGQGLVTLYAAKLAMEGKNAHEIITAVENMKENVHMASIIPGADIFYQNGRTRAITATLCRSLQLHPYVTMKQKKAVFTGLLMGSRETAWKQGIHWHLRKKKKINREVVFITHVGCSVKQQEWIKEEVLKCVPFKRVIIQKASFTNACNTGLESIAIAYYNML